ncbi:MAG TPA: Rho termination factor N-terminal domain-containing protein [Solirubrobacteraceae bacterium]|nr:Rho termination factor N-terminal domain-containing protein [Solirubrobacteraceae bacterium]
MSVLDRSELEASPLADLHAIADQLGLDGFRRLRKAELIAAILGEPVGGARKRRAPRLRRGAKSEREGASSSESESSTSSSSTSSSSSSASSRRGRGAGERDGRGSRSGRGTAQSSDRPGASPAKTPSGDSAAPEAARGAEGVVELLGNGSAFLRVDPPEPSDDDVYISAAQVRRCELVSGDRVTGPVRTPRRSERYPSLVRIDTINGASADTVSEGPLYEDLAVAYPSERLALNAGEPTLDAIEWLTPLGRGSRAVIVGPPRAGKSETLRRLLQAVAGSAVAGSTAAGGTAAGGESGALEVSVVLAGARPEEIAEWQEGPVPPVAALSFAASADAQGQAVERAMDAAKRVAARGGHALVLIDGLDGMHPPAARKTLAAARNLRDGGSLTVIATAARPLGGETTVIALDPALASGGLPLIDLPASGTLKPELLVGEDGAKAISQARAAALEARG